MIRRVLILLLLGCISGNSHRACAGIPEPDVVVYGSICANGVPRSGDDSDVVVSAFIDHDGNQELVGTYRMGEVEIAGTLYVLRIRRESDADGSEQSRNTARANQTVHLVVQIGNETALDGGAFLLDAPGTIRRLDLDLGNSRGTDGDSDADLRDFAVLQRCFTGSQTGELGAQCVKANRDGDGDVDLVDAGTIIDEVRGPCG